MKTSAEEYRQYARECLQAIPLSTSPDVRMVLATMAERWNKLADDAERDAHLQPPDQKSYAAYLAAEAGLKAVMRATEKP